jgi:hypothetical protein
MEELLQAVTSLKKDFQERKLSRLKQDHTSSYEYRLSLLSPKLNSSQTADSKPSQSKALPRVPLIRIPKPQDEFSRYLQGTPHSASIPKTSPSRKRSYKLDAASLLMSRVKKFLAKHFRLWRKNTELLRSLESKIFKSKDLVFKVNIFQKAEKLRYQKLSEDEFFQKAQTTRLSPRSPLGMKGKKQLSIETSGLEINEQKVLHRPASARGEVKVKTRHRAWSDNRLKQGNSSKNKIFLINQFVGVLDKWKDFQIDFAFEMVKKFDWFVYASRIGSRESDGVENVEVSRKSERKSVDFNEGRTGKVFKNAWNDRKALKIEAAVSVLNKIYLNRVSEQFFFMKFRCVVESGFFEESGIVESSQDNLKEYIESIEKNRKKEKSYSHKSISYLVNAPSFVNLMVEVESSVFKRQIRVLFNQLLKIRAFFQVSEIFYGKIREIFRGFQGNKTGVKEKSSKRKLRLLFKALNKSRVFLIETCFSHWKTLPISINTLPLELLTLITTFESLQTLRKRDFFQSFRLCKYKKFHQKSPKLLNMKKSINLLKKHVKFIQKRVFLQLSKSNQRPKPESPSECLKFLFTQFHHKLKNVFQKWKNSIQMMNSLKSLKSSSLLFLSQTANLKLHPFYLKWKHLIFNN